MIGLLFWFFVASILYTYLGYPLLVTLLARIRPYRPKTGMERGGPAQLPVLTLLIAAYNEQEIIGSKLRNSLSLDYPRDRLQILVAADGSQDNTTEIVQSFADRGVELSYSVPRNGKMAAINRAMERSCGEIVVFSDANNFYEPDTLKELVKGFNDPSVAAVTGSKSIVDGDGKLGESEGLYWKYEAYIRREESRLGTCTGVVGEVLAIRSELFEMPPDEVINDDFFMAMRLIRRGYRVLYAPGARSKERVSATAQDEITRRTRIVAGRYQALSYARKLMTWKQPLVAWQLISHKFLRPLVPFAMIGALLTNLIAVITPTGGTRPAAWNLSGLWGEAILLLQILFYLAAWVGNRIRSEGLIGKALYLPTFLVNSNLAALKGLIRFISGRQTARWQRVARRDTSNLENLP